MESGVALTRPHRSLVSGAHVLMTHALLQPSDDAAAPSLTNNNPTNVQVFKLQISPTPNSDRHQSKKPPIQSAHSLESLTASNTLFAPVLSKQAKLQLIGSERRKSFTEIQFDESSRVVRVPSPLGKLTLLSHTVPCTSSFTPSDKSRVRSKSPFSLATAEDVEVQSLTSLASAPPLSTASGHTFSPVHSHLTTTLPYISNRSSTSRTTINLADLSPTTSPSLAPPATRRGNPVDEPPSTRRSPSPAPMSQSPITSRRTRKQRDHHSDNDSVPDPVVVGSDNDDIQLSNFD